ncbi:MAG: DUF6320 domain-containing protein [Lachnospiraceae bacterium]
MVNQKKARWRRLDNAAKLYSAASNKRDTRVFRFYCELKEEVRKELLQEALDQTVETFPMFLMVLRKGLFWHYLEPCNLHPVVKEEYKEPCSRLYVKDKKTLLFEVTYYKKRINFEVFHVLTDGTGATEFLKELVSNYLYLAHQKEGLEPVSMLPEDMTVQDQESDSFLKYYSKDQKRPKEKKTRAFQIRRKKKDGNHLHVHESVVSVKEVLKRSRELGVSMTVFLTAVFLKAIHEEMSKMQEKKPIVLMVPVNLRKFFPSTSMLNFFNWIEPGYDFSKWDRSFEEVLGYTKDFFEEQLTKEKMSAHINDLLALELHPILRLAPLELKNLCIHAGAKFSEKNTTAIFSNMSAVRMPDSYVSYIERFGVFTNTPKLELCLCSFEDKLSFAFTSRYDTVNIERNFYRLLKEQGITAEKVEPEFPMPQMPSEQEMKVYKVYSFLCLVLATAMVVTDLNFHPRIRWTWFTAGGVATMWIASSIGFFKRYNLLKNVMWQLLIGSIICFIWDGFTGWHGWSVDLVLPILSVATLAGMFVIAKVQKSPVREYLIYEIMAAVYGLILPVILLVCGVVRKPTVSMFGALICFLFLVGVILFKGREFKEEMHKNLHV